MTLPPPDQRLVEFIEALARADARRAMAAAGSIDKPQEFAAEDPHLRRAPPDKREYFATWTTPETGSRIERLPGASRKPSRSKG